MYDLYDLYTAELILKEIFACKPDVIVGTMVYTDIRDIPIERMSD